MLRFVFPLKNHREVRKKARLQGPVKSACYTLARQSLGGHLGIWIYVPSYSDYFVCVCVCVPLNSFVLNFTKPRLFKAQIRACALAGDEAGAAKVDQWQKRDGGLLTFCTINLRRGLYRKTF